MNILIYKKTGLFFGLSTLIPWALWFLAGYISYLETGSTAPNKWASIIAFLGLLSPVVTTFFLARNNKEMLRDIYTRIFNFKAIDSTYIVRTFVLMPLSILLAQAVSLLFGYSIEQFQLAETFSFTSGVFPVWFMSHSGRAGLALLRHRFSSFTIQSFYNINTICPLLGNLALSMFNHKRLLPQ